MTAYLEANQRGTGAHLILFGRKTIKCWRSIKFCWEILGQQRNVFRLTVKNINFKLGAAFFISVRMRFLGRILISWIVLGFLAKRILTWHFLHLFALKSLCRGRSCWSTFGQALWDIFCLSSLRESLCEIFLDFTFFNEEKGSHGLGFCADFWNVWRIFVALAALIVFLLHVFGLFKRLVFLLVRNLVILFRTNFRILAEREFFECYSLLDFFKNLHFFVKVCKFHRFRGISLLDLFVYFCRKMGTIWV